MQYFGNGSSFCSVESGCIRWGEVFLIIVITSFVFAFYNTDVADLILAFIFSAICHNHLIPSIDKFWNAFSLSQKLFDHFCSIQTLIINENHNKFLEFPKFNLILLNNCPHKIDETAFIKLNLITLPQCLCFSTFHDVNDVFYIFYFVNDIEIFHDANAGLESDCDLTLDFYKFVEDVTTFVDEGTIGLVIFAVHKLAVELLTDIHLNYQFQTAIFIPSINLIFGWMMCEMVSQVVQYVYYFQINIIIIDLNMIEFTELTDFYQIPQILDFHLHKYVTTQQLIRLFKKSASAMAPRQRHSIRQNILRRMINKGFVCETIDFETSNTCEQRDQYSTAFLNSCGQDNYHKHSIDDIADQMFNNGVIICSQCGAKCMKTSDIIPDALVISYYNQVCHFKGSTLQLSKRSISQKNEERKQVEGGQCQKKTIVTFSQGRDIQISIIELQILQIVDWQLTFNRATISNKMVQLINNPSSKSLPNTFNKSLIPTMMNFICFSTFVRIRNPIIHRDCLPINHENKLILYSFQQVYCRLYAPNSNKKIRCTYPTCQNYFNRDNFQQKSIFAETIRSMMFEESMENLFGMLFGNNHQANWHRTWEESILVKENHKDIIEKYRIQIRMLVKNLVTSANLQAGQKRRKKLQKWLNQTKDNNQSTFNSIQKVKLFGNEQKIIRVKLQQYNICPVRCKFCKNLNALNAYYTSFYFLNKIEKKCPLCQHEISNRFTDCFYIDLQLMKFLFFQGQADEIYYNISKNKYFHGINFFTGTSLRDKLKRNNKIKTYHSMHQLTMNIQLDHKKTFIPFIDERCIEIIKEKPIQANSHYIYLQSEQSINQNTRCPLCLTVVRVDTLYYNEQLEYVLKKSIKNKLCWLENSHIGKHIKNTAIAQVKYYSDIKEQYIFSESGSLNLYWKNYQGALIQYPFKFKGCNHSISTVICDFNDLLYQIKFERKTKFQCRDKNCGMIYEYADDLERVQLDIFDKLSLNPNLMREVLIYNKYWITYSLQSNTIQRVSQRLNQTANLNKQFKKIPEFRHKQRFLVSREEKNKQIRSSIIKLNQNIQLLNKRINQDDQMFSKCSIYCHSASQQEYKNMKRDLQIKQNNKYYLIAQRDRLCFQAQEEARSQNNTSYLNFSRLRKNYPSHWQNLSQKQAKRPEIQKQISFDSFSTCGNVFFFKYPINRIQSNASSIQLHQQN